MDEKLSILLNSEKNIESINVDGSMKIELLNRPTLINEYNVRNVLSVTELFELERQETQVYRIHGKIEYISLLNGLKSIYNNFADFFSPRFDLTTSKTIFNSFDFYLVRPAESGYTQNINNESKFNRFFKVIATPNQFDLFNAGFAKNVFDEQTYSFIFTVDIDISELRDGFGMPITELFLYAQYRISGQETLSFTRWSNTGVQTNKTFSEKRFVVGDYITTAANIRIGDYVEYTKQRFWQTQLMPQTFRISTPIEFIDTSENDPATIVSITSTACVMFQETIQNDGSTFRAFQQNLTFSIPQAQPNDVTIFYKITTEDTLDFQAPLISTTTGSTVILAGQTSKTLFNMPCRYENISNLGAGGWETHITNIDYSLITTTIGDMTEKPTETTVNLIWKYNPFIPIKLRYFENYISRANTGSTSYEVAVSIPDYATDIGNGNFVWREIMPEGYTDPITGIGTDHPFVNKKRYIFSTIVLDVVPDLTDEATLNLFQKLWFDEENETINIRPINNINEINKPCL